MKENLNITENEKKALIDYFSGKLTSEESGILNNWLEKSEGNKLLFDQMTDIWQASHFTRINDKINMEDAWKEIQDQLSKENKKPIQSWARLLKVAAVLILVFILGGIGHALFRSKPNVTEPFLVEYVAPLGSRSFVKMPDGSKIWLNAGTTLSYNSHFGIENRAINLSGEAFFEVEKNPALPFTVQTSELNITALGTKFDVKAYSEEKTIETTLIEGSVRLEGNNFKLTENVILTRNEKAVFVKKEKTLDLIRQNQQREENVSMEQIKPELKIFTAVEPETAISWKDERWIISNEKLESLSKKLERRYAVNFIFDNELLKEYSFGGTLEDETIEQVLDAICMSSPIKYVIEDKTVYIMSDNQKMEKFKHLLMK